jgi:hypothetical protein
MSVMRAFRHDVESVELSEAEVAAFAHLVADLCHLPEQHRMAIFLASVTEPQIGTTCDVAQRQALRMWRTGARL